jgi:DNA-directed RNA polymerase III subunit RPC11
MWLYCYCVTKATKNRNIGAMLFCPFCGTLLLLRQDSPGTAYECQTCAYHHPVIAVTIDTRDTRDANKIVPEGGNELEDAKLAATGQRTTVRCNEPSCDSTLAFFVQEQIRSADEPPTTFYKCCKCGAHWRTD